MEPSGVIRSKSEDMRIVDGTQHNDGPLLFDGPFYLKPWKDQAKILTKKMQSGSSRKLKMLRHGSTIQSQQNRPAGVEKQQRRDTLSMKKEQERAI